DVPTGSRDPRLHLQDQLVGQQGVGEPRNLPWLPFARKLPWIGRSCHRSQGMAVDGDMVWMAVAAIGLKGQYDMRAEPANNGDQTAYHLGGGSVYQRVWVLVFRRARHTG